MVAYTGYDLGHSGVLVTVADEYVEVATGEPDDLERSTPRRRSGRTAWLGRSVGTGHGPGGAVRDLCRVKNRGPPVRSAR